MTAVYSLALWGARVENHGWTEWFEFMKESANLFRSPLTHFAIKGKGLGTRNIRPANTFPEIQNGIEDSAVEWISGYSLPADFQTAAFDYEVHMNLCSSYVSLSVKERFAQALLKDVDDWKESLENFCVSKKGALFQMDDSESPLLFVSGSSPQDSFRTLEILKVF